ncbi:MAG: tetratricopeptide repeat protein [Cyanobacteria bacterium J06643_5]
MKFPLSINSIIIHTSSALLLGFSLPLLAQITVPGDFPECKIINPKTFDSLEEFSKIAGVPKSCFSHMINQHKKALLNQERRNYYDKAIAYEKSGKKRKAILNLNKYIDGNDFFIETEAYIRRGNLYRDLGNQENAIKDYKKADKILQQHLNGVYGNGHMEGISKENLIKVRTELLQLGVTLPDPNFSTAKILKSIAQIEIERALSLVNYNPQHIQDLYKQLETIQTQPYKGTVESMINNAAYEKIEDLKVEQSKLSKIYDPVHPEIMFINKKINQLEALISHNKNIL